MPEGGRIPLAGLNKEMLVYVAGAVGVAAMWKIVQMHALVGYALTTVGVCVLGYLLIYSFASEAVVRHRLWVVIVLTSFSLVFWAFFEQAGSSMNLFADRNVSRTFLGWEPHAIIMQSVNPLFIMALGVPFALMWVWLSKRGLNPSTPLKFGLGIVQLGLGFVALWYGALISQDDGIVALGWLVLGYLLHTTGELCISPVGLSMISRLAPKNMGAMMMGTWYLSFAFASYVAGMIAQPDERRWGGCGRGCRGRADRDGDGLRQRLRPDRDGRRRGGPVCGLRVTADPPRDARRPLNRLALVFQTLRQNLPDLGRNEVRVEPRLGREASQ